MRRARCPDRRASRGLDADIGAEPAERHLKSRDAVEGAGLDAAAQQVNDRRGVVERPRGPEHDWKGVVLAAEGDRRLTVTLAAGGDDRLQSLEHPDQGGANIRARGARFERAGRTEFFVAEDTERRTRVAFLVRGADEREAACGVGRFEGGPPVAGDARAHFEAGPGSGQVAQAPRDHGLAIGVPRKVDEEVVAAAEFDAFARPEADDPSDPAELVEAGARVIREEEGVRGKPARLRRGHPAGDAARGRFGGAPGHQRERAPTDEDERAPREARVLPARE
jgi:hypothetical protein